MKALPEFSHVFRHEWPVEVGAKFKTKCPGNSKGHIGVSRKIEIEVEWLKQQHHPEGKFIGGIQIGISSIHCSCQLVGNGYFLKKAKQYQSETPGYVLLTKCLTYFQLREKMI